ncbi:MAG: hypothetical protein JWR26_375 [Pedosphaera sp.]|nr:hypothetical protein [Pedosphaera sp.]
MASGQSMVSRSSSVVSSARRSARAGHGAAFRRLDRLRLGLRTQPRSVLRRPFDEVDFFRRESIEFINQLVYLLAGGSDGVLEGLAGA